MNVYKQIVATIAVFASALFAHAASYISSVAPAAGSMGNEGNAYTVSELKSASDMSDYNLGTDRGWVAGIKLTWQNNQQNATQTTEEFGDSAGWRSQSSFTVYNNGDKTPSGSGLINTTTSSGSILKTYYNSTAEWYVYVTPEKMYQWSKDGVETYTATLTVKETNRSGWSNVTTPTTYTITIPTYLTLTDSKGVAWYPAVGLLGEKVYGDAQLLADQITLDNYQTVKFLVNPSELTFPEGFAADDEVDGEWGVKMLHNHSWSFEVVDGTNLVATCGTANCPYNNGVVRMWLDVGTTEKDYDGQSVTRKASFDEYFEDVFPGAATALTVNGVVDCTINTAGVYTVALAVAGLGDDTPHELSTTVTINRKDISGATLVLSPASTTYNAKEQPVSASVTVGNLAATLEVAEGSVTSATEIGTYSVTVNGTGNFTGTTSGTWDIVNTTGSLKGVAATTSADAGSYADGTLTVTDTTALAYEEGAWTAGLTLTWPMESDSPALGNGHGHYVKPETTQMTIGETVYTGREIVDSEAVYAKGKLEAEVKNGSYTYYQGLSRRTQNFSYLSSTTWTVAITPAVVEAALAEQKTALEYTMRAGALVWGDSTEGDPDGVAFADYKIELSLEDPILFVLGEGETHDLGETVLTTTKIKLAPGASVTSTVQQTAEGAIFTEATGYSIVSSEEGGVYTYTTLFTHEHAWSYEVVDGTNLVATCSNDDCDLNGEVRMWLHVDTTEKVYDGQSMTRAARYDDNFKTVFTGVSAKVYVNGEEGPINNAGTYEVVMNVTGLGDGETHTLSCTVTVSPVDITDATLVLTPASATYNTVEQPVTPSVTVGVLTATFEVAEGSTTNATEIGEYNVTVNGTGNFIGTTSGKWSIANTTGEPTSVTASAAGSMTNVGNDFTLSDSSKLEYDSENKAWHAGITITWPVETKDWQALSQNSHAYYVTEDCVRINKDVGEVVHTPGKGSYVTGYNWLQPINSEFDYLTTTTWTVELTPAIIDAALAAEKIELEYTMRAGAVPSDTYARGVAFRDYTITIPLEGIKLYDENGKQVYPETEGQTVIDEIKEEVDTEVAEEVAESAKSKIDDLVSIVVDSESPEQAVADWVVEVKNGYDTPAEFYTALAQSDYVEASFELGTEKLITEDSEVEVADFEPSEDGFSFEVKIDDGNIEAARVKAASIIQTATSLGGDGAFSSLNADRIKIVDNKIIIEKDPNFDREFFKIVIDKDSAK